MTRICTGLLVATVACGVLFSETAHAQDRGLVISYAALWGGQLGDGISTARNLGPGSYCREGNAGFYGSATPSTSRVMATKVAMAGAGSVGMYFLNRAHKPTAAKAVGFILGGLGGMTTAVNLTRNCWR